MLSILVLSRLVASRLFCYHLTSYRALCHHPVQRNIYLSKSDDRIYNTRAEDVRIEPSKICLLVLLSITTVAWHPQHKSIVADTFSVPVYLPICLSFLQHQTNTHTYTRITVASRHTSCRFFINTGRICREKPSIGERGTSSRCSLSSNSGSLFGCLDEY
jgi:hypothetical protein